MEEGENTHEDETSRLGQAEDALLRARHPEAGDGWLVMVRAVVGVLRVGLGILWRRGVVGLGWESGGRDME